MFAQSARLKITVFLIAFVLIILPIFFERLHSDEVLYWDVAHNLYTGKGLFSTVLNRSFIGHMPLPFIIAGPFSLIGDSRSGVLVRGFSFLYCLFANKERARHDLYFTLCFLRGWRVILYSDNCWIYRLLSKPGHC